MIQTLPAGWGRFLTGKSRSRQLGDFTQGTKRPPPFGERGLFAVHQPAVRATRFSGPPFRARGWGAGVRSARGCRNEHTSPQRADDDLASHGNDNAQASSRKRGRCRGEAGEASELAARSRATRELREKCLHDLIGQAIDGVAHIVRRHREIRALCRFAGCLRELHIRVTGHSGFACRQGGRESRGVWAGHDGCVIHTNPCLEFFLLPEAKSDRTIRIG